MKENEIWPKIEKWLEFAQNPEPGTLSLDPTIFLAFLDLNERIKNLEKKIALMQMDK